MTYTKNLQILEVKQTTLLINGQSVQRYSMKGEDGTYYSYLYKQEHGDFFTKLLPGMVVAVSVTEKENPKNPKYPYKNIYPVGQNQMQITAQQFTAPTPTPTPAPAPVPVPKIDYEKIKDEKIKDEKIKWLNALNNACLLSAHDKFAEMNLQQIADMIYSMEPTSTFPEYVPNNIQPPMPDYNN